MKIGVKREIDQLNSLDLVSDVFSWSSLPDGGNFAALHIISPTAAAIRIAIRVEELPAQAELRFYEAGNEIDPNKSLVVTGKQILNLLNLNRNAEPDNPESGIYFSPTLEGDAVGLEIYLPPGLSTEGVKISIPYLSHIGVSPFVSRSSLPSLQGYGDSDTCQNDATCYSSTYPNSCRASATAKMIFSESGSSYICTGTMLNDRVTTSWIPYFISANHCISTQVVASTLETLWFYQSSSCNGSSLDPSFQRKYGGARLLWTGETTYTPLDSNKDTSFFRLNDSAPCCINFAGWNAGPVSLGAKTGVHHPTTSYILNLRI